jgi:pilus assembly protein Flp/PilA
MKKIISNPKSEKGQGLVEYVILLTLLAVVVIAVVRLVGMRSNCTYSKINSSLPGSSSSGTCSGSSSSSDPYATAMGNSSNNKNDAIDNFCEGAPEGTAYKVFKKNPNTYIVGGSAVNLSSPFSLYQSGTCD